MRPATCATLALYAAGWYGSSTSIVLLNRWAFGLRQGVHISPTVVTILHMAMKTCLALLVCAVPSCPGGTHTPGVLNRLRARVAGQRLDKRVVLTLLLPMGAVTAADVICSNYAIQLVDVSVYTVSKSTALFWTWAFSVLMQLLPLSPPLAACVLLLLLGVGLCTYRVSTPVNPVGVALACIAALAAATRWVLTERYMGRPGVEKDVLALLGLMGPVTVLALLPPLLYELPSLVATAGEWGPEDGRVLAIVTTAGGSLAFLLVMFELLLVRTTSALTLNVIGHAKDAVVIVAAVVLFHEVLSPANWLGVVLTITAAVAYGALKSRIVGVQPSAHTVEQRGSDSVQREEKATGADRGPAGRLTGTLSAAIARTLGAAAPSFGGAARGSTSRTHGEGGTFGSPYSDDSGGVEMGGEVDTTMLGREGGGGGRGGGAGHGTPPVTRAAAAFLRSPGVPGTGRRRGEERGGASPPRADVGEGGGGASGLSVPGGPAPQRGGGPGWVGSVQEEEEGGSRLSLETTGLLQGDKRKEEEEEGLGGRPAVRA